MEQITAYRCEYCRRIYDNNKKAKAHEKKCYYNPETRSCASCDNFDLARESVPEMPGQYVLIQECKKGIDVANHHLNNHCNEWISQNANQSK